MRRELVLALFDNLTPVVLMSISFAAVGALVVSRSADRLLAGLFAAGALASAARLGIILAYKASSRRSAGSPPDLLAWERIYAAGSFAFATLLGAFAARAVLIGNATTQLLVIAILFGYGSGVVARLSIRPMMSAPSVLLASVPPAVAFASLRTSDHVAIAAVILLFAFGSLETVAHVYRIVVGQAMLRRHLAGLARHDALTGLANRLLIGERLQEALAEAVPAGRVVALHYLDLDGFKEVNDDLGHLAGDRLLQAVARRLDGLLRPADIAGRLGGDEFVVLQTGCSQPGEAELLGWRIGRALQAPFPLDEREVRIGASIGVALAETDDTPETLLARADAALYTAKARGRNRVVVAEDGPPAALAS